MKTGKIYAIKGKVYNDLLACFADDDDLQDFATSTQNLMNNLAAIRFMLNRMPHNDPMVPIFTAEWLFWIGLYFQSNIEVLRTLMSKVDYTVMDKPMLEECPSDEIHLFTSSDEEEDDDDDEAAAQL